MTTARSIFVRLLLLFLMVVFWGSRESVLAAESCSATVSPSSVQTSTDTNFAFSITNTGDGTINYVKIVAPSADFTLDNYGVAGWDVNANSQFAELTGGSILSGAVFNFNYHGTSGSSEMAATDWTVSTNTGSGVVNCTGSLSTAISGVADRTAPDLTELSVSDIGNTELTVNWTTDEAATSYVDYGLDEDYGTVVGSASLTTSHVVTLTGLTSNTTYLFRVYSADASGNTGQITQNTVTTASVTSAGSVTITNTVTNTVTQTQTQTETITKIITDTTPPSIKIDPLDKKVYETAPVVSGSSTDDRGLAKIEFRIMNLESSWSTASLTGAVGAKTASWEFLPPLTLDGSYTMEVRGVDVFGNVSVPKTVEFVIDQLPPTVGGGVVSYGALPLYASEGIVQVMAGLEYEIIVFENGGGDSVKIVVEGQQFELQKMGAGALWRGLVKFEKPGQFTSMVKAVDGAGNETEREWVKFRVLPLGRILQNNVEVKDGQITVFWLDPTTKRYQVWDGREYGENKEQRISNIEGGWGYVLPKGEYYLQTEVNGQKIISQKLNLTNTTTIAGDWEIGEGKWWEKIFKIRRLANLDYAIAPIDHSTNIKRQLVVGREKWIGKKSVVVIGTMQLPWYSESLRRAQEWSEREHAQLVVLQEQGEDDPKGEWLKPLSVGLLPQVYLINDKGDTVDYKEGVWER